MKILNKVPVTMAESKEFIDALEEKKELKDYMKRFTQLSKDKALALSDEIRSLNNLKINEEKIIKIVDFLPRTAEELSKVFSDVSLSEDEVNKILEVVGKY